MFAIMVMCMGVSLVGYVTSSITNIMAIKNAQQTAIASKKQLVMDVLKGRSVPSELSRRVYNFFNYVSSESRGGWGFERHTTSLFGGNLFWAWEIFGLQRGGWPRRALPIDGG